MLTPYQQMLLKDMSAPEEYGKPLAGWKGQQQFFTGPPSPARLTALTSDLAQTFVEGVYFLLRTKRKISIYRGYETEGLEAPFGRDHASFLRSGDRALRTVCGRRRPSLAIDNLKLAAVHREQPRSDAAIKLEWNRLDFYLESELPLGSLIYVGRAAPQQETAAYGIRSYSGGGYQFRLTEPPDRALPWMRRYAAV